jgi:spore germination cell wall hydrolase CwlJ-like protein
LKPPVRLSTSRRAAAVLAVLGLLAAGCGGAAQLTRGEPPARAALQRDLSEIELRRLVAAMDPAMLALARRHDPAAAGDLWGRPEGWERLDIARPPDLGFQAYDPQTAQEINAARPFAETPIRPMRPFRLRTDTADGQQALQCLAQAVYYESAREPRLGQEAVAQVVLNRVRHPAYPKSVCGVVFQGAARSTGCQFSFTCDGSLRWAPEPRLWAQAQGVARRALAGHVTRKVGSATHYHADYVAPYWAPTLVKMKQVGAHIFYRWTGPWGEPQAFVGRYAGGEARLTPAILGGVDERIQGGLLAPGQAAQPEPRTLTLAIAGEVRTYKVADATAPGGEKTRVIGTLTPGRRQPTVEEVKRINENLARFEAGAPAASGVDAAATASADPAPSGEGADR